MSKAGVDPEDYSNNEPVVPDAPLTEVYADYGRGPKRVYRGRVKAHIQWKLQKYQKEGAEVTIRELDEEPA